MAKSSKRGGSSSRGVALKRRLVARDEKLLSPTLADYSTIVLSGDMVVQNFFQTLLPVGDPTGEDIDVALVARLAYSPDFFKAVMSLLVRQYVIFEAGRGKRDEAVAWIKQLLSQIESGKSAKSAQPAIQ